MYAEHYREQKEVLFLTPMLDIAGADDGGYRILPVRLAVDGKVAPPPEVLEKAERGTILERLLREAVTPEEHTLLCLIDELMDEAWKFDTGKALRGELRRLFKAMGFSERRFYAAFHSIEKRVCL